MAIQLPLKFKRVVEAPQPYILIDGGRLGGKSNGTSILAVINQLQHPYTDGIVARVSYGSLADSSYAEIEHALQQFEGFEDDFVMKKSPLRIERKGNAGTIYFLGYGGNNTSRTKSIRPKHKINFVILEETQELKDERNLDEALASFRRHFGEDIKVYVLGNPPPMEAHWFNRFRLRKLNDPDWLCIRMTWEDIVPFINDFDLKEILKTKISDPEYYKWFYMGEANGGFGSVYPMFRKTKHVITVQQFDRLIESNSIRVVGCVIGGDGAVNRDATSFVPIILLNNGQSVIGPIFFHNPKDDGVIGYHQLVQDHLTRWLEEICRRFRLGSPMEMRQHPGMRILPIWMRIDSAAPDLIQECRFFMGDRCNVGPIQKHHVIEMVGVAQSAISNNNMIIIDYGGYYDYMKNKWVQKDMNLLAEQISMLIWNEKQDNYDPIVPNDVCDAWTYGNYFWYSNQENIQYFNILKMNNGKVNLISDILKSKE